MRRPVRVLLLMVLLATTACGLPSIPGLPGSGGGAGAAASGDGLWPDVPELPGATRVPVDLPLPVKLMIKGFIASAQSSSESQQTSKDYDFKVYQAQGPGTDLGAFYSEDRMAGQGWTQAASACGAGSEVPSFGGGLCAFSKPASDGFTDQLVIVLLPGEGDGGADQVAYVRFSAKG